MAVHRIHDPTDDRLDPFRLVRDRDRQGEAARPGLFVGETALVVEAMLARPGCTRSILASAAQAERATALVERARATWPRDAPEPDVLVVPNALVEEIAGFNIHRGLLAIGTRPAPRTVDSLVPASSAGVAPATTPAPCTLLCVEGVNNMDNIGQLFRVAAAFACAGVVLSPECHDPLYRKSLRVSCGHALRVPFARSEAWTADLARLRTAHGFALIGATGHGAPLDGRDAGAAPARTALLVGAEFAGLSPAALAACDRRVRIPMAPGVDSLNVAVAAAVLLDRFSRGTRI